MGQNDFIKSTDSAQRILLVQTGFLGDVILSTPVLASLRRLYPDSGISVLTTPLAADLVRHHPDASEVIIYDKRGADSGFLGLLRIVRELRRRRFSAAFSLHKSYRTALLLFFAGIHPRYGFKEAALPWLYTKTAGRTGAGHEVLRNLAILRAVGREPAELEQSMLVAFPAELPAGAAAKIGISDRDKLVGIAPGSVWATKRWTVEGFAELARMLAAGGYHVVLIGGPDDADVGAQIERAANVELTNAIGRLTLLESAGLISSLRLLISNDSAPLHMASASRTPAVAIFCATVPEFGYGPWQNDHEIVGVNGLSCRPCGRHGGQSCPTGTHACQKDLSATVVFEAAVRLLDNRPLDNIAGRQIESGHRPFVRGK